MDEAHDPLFVHQDLGRHAAEFEDLYLLPVQLQDPVFGIWQTGKGQLMLAEIVGKFTGIFGPGDQNHHIPLDEFLLISAQLRQVRAAEWSVKAPVQDQQDVFLSLELG
jgi:hypothetical protein